MELISITKVCEIVGVTPQTLRNWDKSGKLKPVKRMKKGYRYYNMQNILDLKSESADRIVVGYCRVSSVKQKDDLERQIENVKTRLIKARHNVNESLQKNSHVLCTFIEKP